MKRLLIAILAILLCCSATAAAQPAPAPDADADADVTRAAEPAPAPDLSAKSDTIPVVNLAGLLLERGTRLPLAGITVTTFRDGATPLGYEAISDADGRFVFYDLEPGDWQVAIDATGYLRFQTSETIAAGERIHVTYHLERGDDNPYDVTVTAARPRKEVSRTIIATREIDKVPGGAGDPLTVVQNFAGVARAPTAGDIIVRGSAPKDTRVFIDGAEVPLIFHFGALRSVIPMAILDSIEFYPGNFSAAYGRANGGIVDVKLAAQAPKRIGGSVDLSILDLGIDLAIPLGKKGGITLAGRRSYIDTLLPFLLPDDASVDFKTAPRYYDAELVASYRPAPAHDLRAFFVGSDDRLALLFDSPADLDPALEGDTFRGANSFYRGLLSYRYVPGPAFENTLRLSAGRNWSSFGIGQMKLDFDGYSAQLRDTVRHRFGRRWSLSYGVDVSYERDDVFVNLRSGPPREGEPDQTSSEGELITTTIDGLQLWSPAGFVEAELEPLDGVHVIPGLRFDYFQQTDEAFLQPRLTTRWQIAEPLTVKGGVGLFVQPPGLDETDDNFGNPRIDAERALHYSAGVEVKPLPWLTLDATGFYKDLSHLVSSTDAVEMDGDIVRPQRYDNRGTGTVYGLELVARHELAHGLSGWVAYTLSRSRRRDSGATEDRLFDYDQPHILTAVASYALPRGWQIGARFRLVSGNPETPVIGATFNASSDRYDPMYGPVNSARIDTFHQLDLRIDKRLVFQSWVLGFYLDVQNVYNRANPEGRSYNYDFSESKVQRGLPLLPIFGMRAEL